MATTSRAKKGPTPARPKKAPAAGAEAGSVKDGKFHIPAERILERIQQDPEGARIAQMAFQQCIIEDQHKAIQQLQEELLKGRSGEEPPTA